MIDAYLGFRDGLFILYPCSKILPEDFDHRQRPWYKEHMTVDRTNASPMWGSPYRSVDGDMMLPCTLPMIGMRGTFHGVSAIDVSVQKLVQSLRGMGNRGSFLREKTIVDADGFVVVDKDENFTREANPAAVKVDKKGKRSRYKDMVLFERIKLRRNGIIIRKEKDMHAAYIFSGMYSVDWYFIEKIDLGVLLKMRAIKVPAGINPGQ